jgi:U3 small nucleolar ribonucleoprotein component
MSSQKNYNHSTRSIAPHNVYNVHDINETKKVNVKDLVARLKQEQKKDKKNNILLSAAAVSAVAVFGIILSL